MKSRRQNDQSEPRKRQRPRKAPKPSLVAHGAFAPLLGLWGAMLGGLVVLVLPPTLIALIEQRILVGAAVPLQAVLAGMAALVLGSLVFLMAAAATRRARRRDTVPVVAKAAMRGLRPIDPALDLGTRSLDDPIDPMPFATPAWRDADLDVRAAPEPEPEPEPTAAPVSAPDQSAPRALDLTEFAVLPGRNAVWVEEQPDIAPEPERAPAPAPVEAHAPVTALRPTPPVPASAPVPLPGTAALARLRAVPPSELSLPQMVERFAGALHEHRVNPQVRALSSAELAAREAALAEALKALAALSGNDPAAPASDPLRAALAQLQAGRTGTRGAV